MTFNGSDKIAVSQVNVVIVYRNESFTHGGRDVSCAVVDDGEVKVEGEVSDIVIDVELLFVAVVVVGL